MARAQRFDAAAAEEGYGPCVLTRRWCGLQLVRPGKVQCDCESAGTALARLREAAENRGETDDLASSVE